MRTRLALRAHRRPLLRLLLSRPAVPHLIAQAPEFFDHPPLRFIGLLHLIVRILDNRQQRFDAHFQLRLGIEPLF
jgi:hypothetical protein